VCKQGDFLEAWRPCHKKPFACSEIRSPLRSLCVFLLCAHYRKQPRQSVALFRPPRFCLDSPPFVVMESKPPAHPPCSPYTTPPVHAFALRLSTAQRTALYYPNVLMQKTIPFLNIGIALLKANFHSPPLALSHFVYYNISITTLVSHTQL